jgi:hypothetical protein
MKNIKLIAFATISGLFLSACGGGGSSSTGGSTPPPSTAVMVPSCGTSVADVTGKTIKKVENGAVVRISHTADSKRTACMIKGEAEII